MSKRGVNLAIIVGNLGNDPEMRYMPNGEAVCNISVATSESWTDKNTGQPQERTEWHRVTAYRKLAEIMGQYLKKGSQVYIEGKIQTRKWQAQDGTDRYTTEIVANTMQMLGGKGGGVASQNQPNPSSNGNSGSNMRNNQGQQLAQPHRDGAGFQTPQQPDDNFADDIPFS